MNLAYDVSRIAKLCDNIYSKTKPRSPERTAALEKISESDRENLFDYDMGVLSGRIQKPNYEQEENTMDYETFKKLSDSNASGTILELSQFAKRSPELYKQHRERYQEEKDRERRSHNRKIMGH